MEAKKRLYILKKYHCYILGKRGQRWKELETATGTKIQIPSLNEQSETILITGTQERLNKAENEIRLICKEMDSRVKIICHIEKRYRFKVLGPKGCNVQAIRDKFRVHIQFPGRSEDDTEEMEASDSTPIFDEVEVSGVRENAEAAKEALLDLVPMTIQVEVPNHLHYLLIGRGGCEVREFNDTYNVNLLMARPDEQLDYVKIIGTRKCVEEAKKKILEKCEILKAGLQNKALKSYELKVEVDSEYFHNIVGREGVVIKKIISDHDVAISFPRVGDPEENIITITGYEKNTKNARDDILKLISELKPKVNSVFGQFMPPTQDKPLISSSESTISSIQDTDTSCERNNIQEDTEELLLNGEFESGDEEDSSESSESEREEEHEVEKKVEASPSESSDLEDSEREEEQEVEKKVEAPSEIDELYKNFKAHWSGQFDLDKSMSLIREHAALVTEALRSREDSQKKLTEMYTELTWKQNKEISDLRKRLNDEVSLHETWSNERHRLMLEVENEKIESKRIIDDNEQKYKKENQTLSDTIADLQRKLNAEREEKSKLIEENDKILKINNTLIAKTRELETTHELTKMDWESSVAKLAEKEKILTYELNELKNEQARTLKNENLKIEFYSMQLENLKLQCDNTLGRLDQSVSRNEQLVKDGATKDEKINALNTLLQQKDDKLRIMETSASALTIRCEELSSTIESLKNDLVIKETEILEIETEFDSYKANVNDHVLREMAVHEAKFERIRYNVSDLKEKLAEITNDIINASSDDIYGMLNGFRNTNNIQSSEKFTV